MAEPAVKLDWTETPSSSNVHSVAYDKDTETLAVRFLNGGLYSYAGVGLEVFTGLVHAASVGRYLNTVIKGVNPYTLHVSESDLIEHVHHRRK